MIYRISWLGESKDDVILTQETSAGDLDMAVSTALTIRRRCYEERYLNEEVARSQGFFVEAWSSEFS